MIDSTSTEALNDQTPQRHHHYQQQQQWKQKNYDENLQTRRITSETIAIGREIAETLSRQGETINRADDLVDQHEYALDRSARLLRGMTWSGWVANMFTSDVKLPDANAKDNGSREHQSPTAQKNGPMTLTRKEMSLLEPVAHSVKNFHKNVMLLESCETREQIDAAIDICSKLNKITSDDLRKVTNLSPDAEQIKSRIEEEYKIAEGKYRKRLRAATGDDCEDNDGKNDTSSAPLTSSRRDLFSSVVPPRSSWNSKSDASSGAISETFAKQEAHVSALSADLIQLKSLGLVIGDSMMVQNDVLRRMEDKSETLTEKAKMVTRRADRLTRRSAWSKEKPVFESWVTIKTSDRYLSVTDSGLTLTPQFLRSASIFGLWRRRQGGSLIGLQNQLTQKWMGQNILGNILCTASHFKQWEEWEIDDDNLGSTTLLCASANWGGGGYIGVNEIDWKLVIASTSCDVESKRKAIRWSLRKIEEVE